MFQIPADGKRLIDLHCLAGLYALSAENALAGVVAIERIGHVHFIRLGLEWMLLVLNIQLKCGVVDPAILIVVIADSAVEHVIAKDHIEGFGAGIFGSF